MAKGSSAGTLLRRVVTLALVAAALVLAPWRASAADGPAITFTDVAGKLGPVPTGAPGSSVQEVTLDLYFRLQGPYTDAQLGHLTDYLSSPKVYWSEATEGVPMLVDGAMVVAPGAGYQQLSTWRVRLIGKGPSPGRGFISVAVPPAGSPAGEWKFAGGNELTGPEPKLRYYFTRDWKLPTFRPQIAPLEFGEGGFSFSASGEGVAHRGATSLTTLSLDVRTPIGTPRDVEDTPGAEDAASRENPGRFLLALNHTGYQRGHGKRTYGLRLRASGPADSLRGAEGVAYLQPVMGWFKSMHGFYGAEAEIGIRKGDEEWETLTMKAPDRGNAVARIGAVVEWAPVVGGINRDLSKGLRFFVRGRGWADMYKDDSGDRTVRLRPFLDAELFTNFGAAPGAGKAEWRVFLRGEAGYLPPDLTTRLHRAWVGVGAAF